MSFISPRVRCFRVFIILAPYSLSDPMPYEDLTGEKIACFHFFYASIFFANKWRQLI
jgi:hypothetical protein